MKPSFRRVHSTSKSDKASHPNCNIALANFATAMEVVCGETVESGQMTKDLALLLGPGAPWLTTEEFLAALDE